MLRAHCGFTEGPPEVLGAEAPYIALPWRENKRHRWGQGLYKHISCRTTSFLTMDTAPTVAALPSDSQSNGATSNVEGKFYSSMELDRHLLTYTFTEILALLEAISLSPGDVQRLTTAIHNQIDSSASSPTPTTPHLPALDIADEHAAAPVQVQEAADPNPVLLEPLAAIP